MKVTSLFSALLAFSMAAQAVTGKENKDMKSVDKAGTTLTAGKMSDADSERFSNSIKEAAAAKNVSIDANKDIRKAYKEAIKQIANKTMRRTAELLETYLLQL